MAIVYHIVVILTVTMATRLIVIPIKIMSV